MDVIWCCVSVVRGDLFVLRLVLLWFIRLKFCSGRWEKGVNSRFIFKTINVSMTHICHLIRFCLSLSKVR